MSMTVEEALQQAEKLREQGCITITARALLALADAYQKKRPLTPEEDEALNEALSPTKKT